jgi:hypothetical protein
MMSLNITNSNNAAGNRSTQRPSLQSSQQQPAVLDRKGLGCLSQDRVIASAAANNMMKTTKSGSTN